MKNFPLSNADISKRLGLKVKIDGHHATAFTPTGMLFAERYVTLVQNEDDVIDGLIKEGKLHDYRLMMTILLSVAEDVPEIKEFLLQELNNANSNL